MSVDVRSDIDIARPRIEVAAYAGNLDNTTEWYQNIEAVDWKTPKPQRVGSQIAFVARFLGRALTYTYEVTELIPGCRLVMRTAEGPFPMETSYIWEDHPTGGTRMTLRNRGEPAGFVRLTGVAIASAMRRANRKDLRQLKQIVEHAGGR